VLDEPNEQLVDLLMREEVVRHVTAMYTLERIAARDWARTRTLMASINQVRGTGMWTVWWCSKQVHVEGFAIEGSALAYMRHTRPASHPSQSCRPLQASAITADSVAEP